MTAEQITTEDETGPRRRIGSVSQLPSTRWSVRVRDIDGRRFRLSGGPWASKEEAERALYRWLSAAPIDPESAAAREVADALRSTPLAEVYSQFLTATHRRLEDSTDRQTFARNVITGEAGVWRPLPLTGRQRRVRREWLSPIPGRMVLGTLPISSIRRQTIQAWVQSLTGGEYPLAPSTVVKWGRHLNQTFEWAVANEYMDLNPLRGLELFPHGTVRRQRPPRFFLTLPEMIALTNAAPAEHRLLIETLLWTGMRQGEVRALREESFRRSGSIIFVDRAVHDGRGAPTIGRTKTTGSVRRIAVPTPLHAALHDEALHYGPGKPIFPGPSGGWMRGDDLNEFFARTREAAGILGDPDADNRGRRKPPTPHDCRATGASLLQAAGASAPIAQAWLGHANSQITLDLYTEIEEHGEEDRLLTSIRGESLTVGEILDRIYVEAWQKYGKPTDPGWPF